MRTELDGAQAELAVARDESHALHTELDVAQAARDVLHTELGDARARVDELEGTRADDRRIAEQALAGLRTKAETATGRIRVVEEEMAALRGRHAGEIERMSTELEHARARVDAVDVELTERREREDDLRRALRDAEHRAASAGSARPPSAAADTVPAPPPASSPHPPAESVARRRPAVRRPEPKPGPGPERVPVAVGGGSDRASGSPHASPPSELRRAVFASLTELAGDAPE